MDSNDRMVLIDGYAQIYRGFFAIRELTAPDGRPSNALFGIARFMLNIDAALPHRLGAMVLDKGKPVHRMEILPEYKATRPPMPDEMRSQIQPIRAWVAAMGWEILEAEGHEADDLIAGVVSVREGHEVAIVSHDKDLSQLVQPGVTLVIPGKKSSLTILDRAGVIAKFGVPPEHMRDYIALVGDSVDNIDGVAGIGPKTAAKLLNEIGGLDEILENLEKVSRESLRKKLAQSSDLLRRNRRLVALPEVLPETWHGIEQLKRGAPDWETLLAMADDYGFSSLKPELRKRWAEERNPTLF